MGFGRGRFLRHKESPPPYGRGPGVGHGSGKGSPPRTPPPAFSSGTGTGARNAQGSAFINGRRVRTDAELAEVEKMVVEKLKRVPGWISNKMTRQIENEGNLDNLVRMELEGLQKMEELYPAKAPDKEERKRNCKEKKTEALKLEKKYTLTSIASPVIDPDNLKWIVPPTDFGAKGPPIHERYVKSRSKSGEHLRFPFVLLSVDVENELAYIRFEDVDNCKIRMEIANHIVKYLGPEGTANKAEYAVKPEDIVEGQVYIFQDRQGILRRAYIIAKHPTHSIYKLLDVDTLEMVEVEKLEAYRMDAEVREYFHQVVAVKVKAEMTPFLQGWLDDNSFLFREDDPGLLSRAVYRAIGRSLGLQRRLLSTMKVEMVPGTQRLCIYFDIIETPHLKNYFVEALRFLFIPRPEGARIGLITHVNGAMEDPEGNVMLYVNYCEPLFFDIRKKLSNLQTDWKQFRGRMCPTTTRELGQQFHSGRYKEFRLFAGAISPENWEELHRLYVIDKIQNEEQNWSYKVKYLDTGKVALYSSSELLQTVTPIPCTMVPEMLSCLPDQAVPIKLAGIDQSNLKVLREMKEMLEGKTCYVKVLEEDEWYLAEIYLMWDGEINSLADIVNARNAALDPEQDTDSGRETEMKEANLYPLEPLNKLRRKLKKFEFKHLLRLQNAKELSARHNSKECLFCIREPYDWNDSMSDED